MITHQRTTILFTTPWFTLSMSTIVVSTLTRIAHYNQR
ncbi:hypothetical protein BVRB_6g150700 [Beta vulgaris subsp. vulgaris]|nr:hypothetical protein BVRB_6g150700 [Beta vulgaris subsp. vulgaris]